MIFCFFLLQEPLAISLARSWNLQGRDPVCACLNLKPPYLFKEYLQEHQEVVHLLNFNDGKIISTNNSSFPVLHWLLLKKKEEKWHEDMNASRYPFAQTHIFGLTNCLLRCPVAWCVTDARWGCLMGILVENPIFLTVSTIDARHVEWRARTEGNLCWL